MQWRREKAKSNKLGGGGGGARENMGRKERQQREEETKTNWGDGQDFMLKLR